MPTELPRAPQTRHYRDLIRDATEVGAAARAQMIEAASRLPLERLMAMPPADLRLLGPRGLLEAVRRKSALETAPAPDAKSEGETTSGRLRPGWALAVALALVFAGGLVEHVVPFFSAMRDVGARPLSSATWPACARLDARVDGCVYSVGGAGELTGEMAARLLGISEESFFSVNRPLAPFVHAPLPSGAKIVVWRGRLNLED